MKIITKRDHIKEWIFHFRDIDWPKSYLQPEPVYMWNDRFPTLPGLDPETCTISDLAVALDMDRKDLALTCDECGKPASSVVQLGDDHEIKWGSAASGDGFPLFRICPACLAKATTAAEGI